MFFISVAASLVMLVVELNWVVASSDDFDNSGNNLFRFIHL